MLLPTGGHKSMNCWLTRESGKACCLRLSGNPGRCWGKHCSRTWFFATTNVNISTSVWIDQTHQTVSLILRSCAFIRDGCKLFFDHLGEQRVPLLLLSAGVGDVLEEVIRQNHVFHPNVRIISNYMDFDQAVSSHRACVDRDFTFMNWLNATTNWTVTDSSGGDVKRESHHILLDGNIRTSLHQ